jgi:hypothetical protein
MPCKRIADPKSILRNRVLNCIRGVDGKHPESPMALTGPSRKPKLSNSVKIRDDFSKNLTNFCAVWAV